VLPSSGRQKVLRKLFVWSKNARFYLMCRQSNMHENLMQESCARNLCKILDCVSPALELMHVRFERVSGWMSNDLVMLVAQNVTITPECVQIFPQHSSITWTSLACRTKSICSYLFWFALVLSLVCPVRFFLPIDLAHLALCNIKSMSSYWWWCNALPPCLQWYSFNLSASCWWWQLHRLVTWCS